MSSLLIIIGGLVFVGMGLVHGLVSCADVLRPTQFAPVNDSVRIAMKSTTVRFLRARANVWDAWLGFNLSHSLGMLMFGAASVWVGINLETSQVSPPALVAPVIISLMYLALSIRFWFWVPALSSGIATGCFIVASLLTLASGTYASDAGNRITILYDAFGRPSNMQKDWGFSAFVEYGGKRILFDTGNNAENFAHNVRVAGVDLKKLDFVVISHRHLDHTAGLSYLQTVNRSVTIYAPMELAGMFGSSLPSGFYRKDESLPAHMRYYDSDPPKSIEMGTPWTGAKFESVDKTFEVAPGVHLISVVSDVPGTLEMRELSLAIETPTGLLLIAGCSHPGIERIVEAARMIDQRIYMILGGFHLPSTPNTEIARIATTFHDTLNVEHLAASHCTGEPAFAFFQKTWGKRYVYAGVGTVIDLP